MKERKIPEIDGVTYIAESVLGQGGTAEVLKVRSSADNGFYALKSITKSPTSARNERFRNEIGFGLRASHPNVMQVHAWAEDEEHFYYIMDLLPKTLRDFVRDEADHQALLHYISQLCAALAYVHGEDIVHRDIKPENILVDPAKNRLVLADFGIAHFKDSTLTKRGEIIANRNYQAPEQMAGNNPELIDKPADIFALGLIIREAFTKQNSRGTRHLRIGDIYPFLSDLDLLVEKMTLQDGKLRPKIEAVCDSLTLIQRQTISRVQKVFDTIHPIDIAADYETARILEQASTDILSAKFIFERAPDAELSRYNPNYHCEISYSVSEQLYNACVQSRIYSMCKSKFEYEAHGIWAQVDLDSTLSPLKAQLMTEFDSIQHRYPLAPDSIWHSLPRLSAHYFRFCKDYHCQELLESIRENLLASQHYQQGNIYQNLVNAPIIWIVQFMRYCLRTDRFEISQDNLESIEFERHVSVSWEETSFGDLRRRSVGANLFLEPNETEMVEVVLRTFESRWRVSLWERSDRAYSIYFRSREEYDKFRAEALSMSAHNHVFQGDVLDLLRPEAEYDDLIALTWETGFDIPNTLAKILQVREING